MSPLWEKSPGECFAFRRPCCAVVGSGYLHPKHRSLVLPSGLSTLPNIASDWTIKESNLLWFFESSLVPKHCFLEAEKHSFLNKRLFKERGYSTECVP